MSEAELLDPCGSPVAGPDPSAVLLAVATFAIVLPTFAVTLMLAELRALPPDARLPNAQF
jgi:hypothetical protein